MHAVRKIHDFARETPDATALVADLEPISYRTFDRRIAAARRALAARRLRPGGVAVSLIDDILIGWLVDLALRSLGHTTLAIRTAAELANLGDLDVVAVVTLAEERRRAPPPDLPPAAARVAIERAECDETDAAAPPTAATPGDHILLTSATTGKYKMIRFDLAQEARVLELARRRYAEYLETSDRPPLLNLFNFGLWTLAGYPSPVAVWSLGAGVVVHHGPDFHRSLDVPGVTHATVTPALLAQVMAAPAGSFGRHDDLELSVVAGALSEALFYETRARLTENITVGMGSTEGGGWASTRVKSADDLRWHRVTEGRKVEIVDEQDRPLPPGKLGQVRVAQQEGISGYLNDVDATAAFFREGWFYPGDLGVIDDQGRLALFGRVTDVVNRAGDKLPAAPYEDALQRVLGVEGVCVLSEQGPGAGEDLHVVVETAAPIDEARLQDLARSCLVGFAKVHFHFLGRLPRNHMGKVERLKLRQQLIGRRAAE